MVRRVLLVWLAALAVVVVVASVVAVGAARRVRVGEEWSPARMHAALAEAGEKWEAHLWYGNSVLLKRAGDVTPWEEMGEDANGRLTLFGQKRGRLYINRRVGADRHPGPAVELNLGPLTVRGHPDELQRVAELFD